MTSEPERPLEELFHDQMIGGYRDGCDPDSPGPSADRSEVTGMVS